MSTYMYVSTYVCMYTCIHTCTTVLYVCVCLRTYVLTYILFVLMCALSATVLQFKLLTSISSFMDYWYAPPAPDAFVIVLGKCVWVCCTLQFCCRYNVSVECVEFESEYIGVTEFWFVVYSVLCVQKGLRSNSNVTGYTTRCWCLCVCIFSMHGCVCVPCM